MSTYIALDIGGTAIKHCRISENGEILESHEVPTEAKRGGPYIIEKVQNIIARYKEIHILDGICVSTAGIVNPAEGSIVYANENIPNYTGMKLKDILEKRFGIPCEVENDVVCAGLAEHVSGASMNYEISVCLTVGTGIGGCILIGSKILRGAAYSAGEFGYMKMMGAKFEDLASSRALVKKVAKLKGCDQQKLDGITIFQKAAEGDEICIDAIDEMCNMLGYGISNICYVLNPDVVVIGGGVAKNKDYLYDRIRKGMDRYLIPQIGEKTELAFALHGNEAGMLGAYYNFIEKRSGDKYERV